MAKIKKSYICRNCGAVFGRWEGRCPECRQWNCIEESAVPTSDHGYAGAVAEICPMAEVKMHRVERISTGMKEFDRVLGGGLVPGSVVLIGGDPGVGKSTALLQVCCNLRGIKSIYVSGEESLAQIAMRARRLGLPADDVLLISDTEIESICAAASREAPQVLVIDSIQTMQVTGVASSPGSVSQVRESAAHLTRFAKKSGIAIFLVGHVTKTGGLAGPRVLEHIIDVVVYLEDTKSRFRIMRAIKNRYGAVNELGVFAMTEGGMKEISNPSAIFLSRRQERMSGSAVMVLWEGSRPLLVEIQALVDTSYAEHPRRLTVGLEANRLTMMLAVLHKHGGLVSFDKDVFVNVVGGVKVVETSADLALLLAIVSSMKDSPLPDDLIIFGEVGLAGEIRPVANGQERLREAAKHGFKRAIISQANVPNKAIAGLRIDGVNKLSEALEIL
ncbi:DNA repair protein RadA [Desulfobacterota bacterium M19]